MEQQKIKGIRKHQSGKWMVNVTVNKVRKFKIFELLEDAIEGRKQIKMELQKMATMKEQNGFYVISGSTSQEALTTTLNIEAQNRTSKGEVANYIFPTTGQNVRVVMHEGKPWFVASDVAKVLGYEKPNNAVHGHCKNVNKFSYPKTGQLNSLNIIPESDVYRLVIRSNIPAAEAFQDWVCEEVLPALRQHGHYGNPMPPASTLTPFDAQAIIAHLDARMEALTASLVPVKVKAERYDTFLNTEGDFCFTEAGQQFGMSARQLAIFLQDVSWVWKAKTEKGNEYRPIQSILNKGYLVVKTVRNSRNGKIASQTRITPKGMDALAAIIANTRV